MTRLSYALVFMVLAGCDCLFFPDPGGGSGGGSGGSGGNTEPPVHEACQGVIEEMPDLAKARLALAMPGIADGTQEIGISPSGCIVLRREYVGGRLTALSLRRFYGFVTILDGGIFNPVLGEYEAVFLETVIGADRSVHTRIDSNANRKIDFTIDELWGSTLMTSRTSAWLDEANGNVIRRETVSSVNNDTIHWKVEALRSGVLTAITDRDAPARQNQKAGCYTMPAATGPKGDVVDCPVSDMKMRERIKQSIERTSLCLQNLDPSTFNLAQLELYLMEAVTLDSLKIECFRDPSYHGQAKLNENVLKLNADMMGCDDDTFIDSTITHELLHFSRGPHDFDHETVTGPYGPRADTYSDSARSCEALCYGTLKTKCSCAKCLRTKACDTRCEGFDTCRQNNDAGMATMSEAVGAHCQTDNAWFSTMSGCTAAGACTGGASNCKSYSLSCDPTCQ